MRHGAQTPASPGPPGRPRPAPSRLQPAVAAARVPARWLAPFATTGSAADLARLEGDRDLLLRLQLAGFAGEEWAFVEEALARYGFQVMRAWVVSGDVFTRRAEKGFRPRIAAPGDGRIRKALREEGPRPRRSRPPLHLVGRQRQCSRGVWPTWLPNRIERFTSSARSQAVCCRR